MDILFLSRRGDSTIAPGNNRQSEAAENTGVRVPTTQKEPSTDGSFCREEVTRTPDPYVPNVVRYQLRYFSLTFVRFDYLLAQIFSSVFHESGCKITTIF